MTTVLCLFFQGYAIIVLAHLIFAWVPRPPEPLVPIRDVVRTLVDPILQPLRRVIPNVPLGGAQLDVSFIVLLIGISLLSRAFC